MPTRTAPRRLSKIIEDTHSLFEETPSNQFGAVEHSAANNHKRFSFLAFSDTGALGRSSLCNPSTADFLEEALLDLDLVPRTEAQSKPCEAETGRAIATEA